MMAVYDDTAAIGKLYRRQDEIGTPWCVTVDVESLEDGAVTVRDRDSMTQERVPVEGVTRLILDRLDAAPGRGRGATPVGAAGRDHGAAVEPGSTASTTPSGPQATFAFETAERFVWAYTPGPRDGPALRDMRPDQRAGRDRDRRRGAERPERGRGRARSSRSRRSSASSSGRPGGTTGRVATPSCYWFAVFGEPGCATPVVAGGSAATTSRST